MQYVWQHRLLLLSDLVTVDGRKVSIIDPGLPNNGSGPDFFNAKVRIGDRLWAGDVEIHVRASDWHRHGHDGDRAYDSVVLHVVDRDDTPIQRSNGEVIPQMVMRCAPDFHVKYSSLVDRSDLDLPCAADLAATSPLHLSDWITSLAYERVYAKADHLGDILGRVSSDWEQAAYILLARALGFGINSEPMERLAVSMPLAFLRKHSDSLTSVEALLLGQGGFLADVPADDPYAVELAGEYRFLSHKFSLEPMLCPGWKTGRLRPSNRPESRIATLAGIIAGSPHLADTIVSATSAESLIEYFRRPLSAYWSIHYTFGPASPRPHESMSRASAAGLVINVAVPFMVAWGNARADEEMVARAFEWLQGLPAESNRIIDIFAAAGVKSRDAFTTQALIQARRAYCEPHRCIYCRIGHRALAARAKR